MLRVATAGLALCGLAGAAKTDGGQRKPAKNATAGSRVAVPCGGGARLTLSSSEVAQGSLIVVHLAAKTPIESAKAEWDGREMPLWEAGKNGEDWAGLLGVDLEKAPGKYEASIAGKVKSGGDFRCEATIEVRSGRFPTENLKVEKQFVEPDPEQLARAKEETQKLRGIFATVTAERLWNGPFRVPLDGVTTGGNFGRRRVLNGEPGSPHTGVDFPASTGTPVHAAQAGRVVLAEPLFFAGNTVIVDHGLGVYTFYGHLSAFSVHAGEEVKAGTELGKVGATGRVTGPHLHWGVTVDRERVNGLGLVNLPGIS